VADFHRESFEAVAKDLTVPGFLLILPCLSGKVFSLSGAAPSGLESLSWKGNIFGPGTSKTEWDRRAAGMGRQPRKAE